MQDGTRLQNGGKGGRPVKISEEQICAEIEQRLSGHPDDLVASRIQRTLKARHGSTLHLMRIQRLMCEMHRQRQAPVPTPRQPEVSIDTTTAGGRLTFHIFGALAQFERDIIRERTVAGLEAAATRGRKGGRPKAMGAAKIEAARLLLAGGMPIKEVAATLEVGISIIYRYG